MARPNRMSVVLPVRDGRDRIEKRIDQVLGLLDEMIGDPEAAEVIVVDDGSQDDTAEYLGELAEQNPRLRLVRHSRVRGMEAAGQTGLERATGDLVFIQEDDADIREDDMKKLYQMSQDPTVLAARAQTQPPSFPAELIRRLVAWGVVAQRALPQLGRSEAKTGLQMIRRPHLQRLVGPQGDRYRLQSETIRGTSETT
ncbi:glycosyltransferase family 2 protein [Crateriforma conspicua]|uniref:Putative glycosyltransferase n=1 Tax=Crateriforma conspicua TaxID=2527996 RepID=A0A5C5XRA4_9PLAN|nr:glycosyltransferase [Crateriforma conspicua]QDV60913.1 Putative glycosyltransferase [Crateriforma conspicua]TWT65756.1 putative glycosyltransferase [Crateriforma conspicua]